MKKDCCGFLLFNSYIVVMKCLNPTTAYLCGQRPAKDGLIGPHLVFSYDEALCYWKTPQGVENHTISFPCGHCDECVRHKRKAMACRIANEASLTPHDNCFITLTYDEVHLPQAEYCGVPRGTLRKKHLQDFMKRLRRRLDYHYNIRVRFFACGEYGSKTKRPHYHLVIFGWCPDFTKCDCRGNNSYVCPLLSGLWDFGFHLVQKFEVSHANYVAGYVTKKLSDIDLLAGCENTFYLSSRRGGGIGAPWFRLYGNDAIANGRVNVLSRDRVIQYAVPQYYYRLQRRLSPEQFQAQREKRALCCKNNNVVLAQARKDMLKYSMSLEEAVSISLEEFNRVKRFAAYSINKQNESDKL